MAEEQEKNKGSLSSKGSIRDARIRGTCMRCVSTDPAEGSIVL